MGLLSNVRNALVRDNPNPKVQAPPPSATPSAAPSSNYLGSSINSCISLMKSTYDYLPEKVQLVGKIYLGALVVKNTIGMKNAASLSLSLAGLTINVVKDFVALPMANSALEIINDVSGVAVSEGGGMFLASIAPYILNLYIMHQTYQVAKAAIFKSPEIYNKLIKNENVRYSLNLGFSTLALGASIANGNNLIIPSVAFLLSLFPMSKIYETVRLKPGRHIIYLNEADRQRYETLRPASNSVEKLALEKKAELIYENQPQILQHEARRAELDHQLRDREDAVLRNEINYVNHILYGLRNPSEVLQYEMVLAQIKNDLKNEHNPNRANILRNMSNYAESILDNLKNPEPVRERRRNHRRRRFNRI